MLVSSDPIVTNMRKKPKKNKTQFNEIVLSMLRLPTFCGGDDDANDDQESDDDDKNDEDEDVE